MASPKMAQPAATVLGRGLLDTGEPFSLVDSASAPTSSHVVAERGPDGRYTCDCLGAQHEKRCRHVNAVIALELAEALTALQVRHEASGARQAAMTLRYQELAAYDEQAMALQGVA